MGLVFGTHQLPAFQLIGPSAAPGAHRSVRDLVASVRTWITNWNEDPKPFIWHKTAEEIVTKVRRGRASLAQVKSATHD